MSSTSNTTKQYNVEITTSPDFIQMMGKKLYSNPLLAILVRELLQNSRDATMKGIKTSGKIDITVNRNADGNTDVVCDDTGIGMDESTLVNTFLQIGGTKKAEGSVGGFGVAKVSLFATGLWSVHTRNNFVDSSMVYNQVPNRKGTRVTATVKPTQSSQDYAERLAELFVKSSNVKNVWFNGEKVHAYKARKCLDIRQGCVVSTAPKLLGYSNKVFYRIHGLTQYMGDLGYGDDYGFNIVVDFDAIGYAPRDDNYPFDASREKVNAGYDSFVRNTVAPLAKNVLTSRSRYAGPKEKREFVQHRAKQSTKNYIIVNAPKTIEVVDRNILQLWREVFEAILVDMTESTSNYGMIYDGDTNAERRIENGLEYFLVNSKNMRELWSSYRNYNAKDCLPFVLNMWHLAVHELTHRFVEDHDENFSSREHALAHNTALKLNDKLDSLRPQARKCLKGIVELNNK